MSERVTTTLVVDDNRPFPIDPPWNLVEVRDADGSRTLYRAVGRRDDGRTLDVELVWTTQRDAE